MPDYTITSVQTTEFTKTARIQKRHFIALKAIGKNNTGSFTSASIDLEISIDEEEENADFVSVGTVTLNNADEANIFQYDGVVSFFRANVTAITVSGDATLELHLTSVEA